MHSGKWQCIGRTLLPVAPWASWYQAAHGSSSTAGRPCSWADVRRRDADISLEGESPGDPAAAAINQAAKVMLYKLEKACTDHIN